MGTEQTDTLPPLFRGESVETSRPTGPYTRRPTTTIRVPYHRWERTFVDSGKHRSHRARDTSKGRRVSRVVAGVRTGGPKRSRSSSPSLLGGQGEKFLMEAINFWIHVCFETYTHKYRYNQCYQGFTFTGFVGRRLLTYSSCTIHTCYLIMTQYFSSLHD